MQRCAGRFILSMLLIYLTLCPSCRQSTPEGNFGNYRKGFIVSDGVDIFFEAFGEGEPVVIVHGGPGLDHSYLKRPLQALSNDFHLYFYDQRCVGQSGGDPVPRSVSIDAFVRDLEALRNGLGLEKFHLVGHSWGALLSMVYATKHQDKLLSLVLLNPIPATYKGMMHVDAVVRARHEQSDREVLEQLSTSEEFFEGDRDTVNNFLNHWFSAYLAPGTSRDFLHFDVTERTAKNWSRVNALMVRSLGRFDFRSDISYIDVPTLLVQGEGDVIPTEYIAQIHTNIPAAEHALISDSGHFPFLETPEVLLPMLRSFLSKHSSQAE